LEADQNYARRFDAFGLPVGRVIDSLLRTPGTILYFPPGNYLLEALPGNAPYVCAIGVQMFFASGALLRVAGGVMLRIQGTIRAGNYQIFGFSSTIRNLVARRGGREESVDLEEWFFPHRVSTWPIYRNGGRIIIESDDIPLVRPEWWGADVSGDCWDAFQGAIDAACIGRAGRSPIPIVLGGPYKCFQALDVRAPLDDGQNLLPVCLVLRGGGGVNGASSIIRTYAGVGTAPRPAGLQVALRLHPGVDFDFRDVKIQCADELDGCVDVICSSQETTLRRGFMQRVTLLGGLEFQLRITEEGRSRVCRHFVLDSCALHPVQFIPCRNALRLDVGPTVILRVSNSGPAAESDYRGPIDSLPQQALDQSNCHLIGGSVLLDSLMFHNALGPRPSRFPLRLDEPDGQDIFLGVPTQADRPTTHLTVVQCESQGWWFLSRDPRVRRAHQVVLLGVAHAAVVWHLDRNRARRDLWYTQWRQSPKPGPSLPVPLGGAWVAGMRGRLPSVVWQGDNGQCVLIGCRLSPSVIMTDLGSVVNVGSTFATSPIQTRVSMIVEDRGLGDPLKIFQRPGYMIDLRTGYMPVEVPLEATFDSNMPRLVPILEDTRPAVG